jgi:hypothetical protein
MTAWARLVVAVVKRFALSGGVGLVLLMLTSTAEAFTVTITPASPRTVFLQIGAGTFAGGSTCNFYTPAVPSCYRGGGSPQANAQINTVSVTVPVASVGNGTAQSMTTDSTVTQSSYDGYVFCGANQLYIGSFYRTASAGTFAAATLRATAPANLIDATGDTLPFSQISWTSSGNGDTPPEVFPGGAFNGTGVAQTLGTVAANQWAEACWSFQYLNTLVAPGGTYIGRVIYTLTAP